MPHVIFPPREERLPKKHTDRRTPVSFSPRAERLHARDRSIFRIGIFPASAELPREGETPRPDFPPGQPHRPFSPACVFPRKTKSPSRSASPAIPDATETCPSARPLPARTTAAPRPCVQGRRLYGAEVHSMMGPTALCAGLAAPAADKKNAACKRRRLSFMPCGACGRGIPGPRLSRA